MPSYNVRVKLFPNGAVQTTAYDFPVLVGEERKKKPSKIKKDGSSVERKEIENRKRAMNVVYDLARSNEFQWFITMTFDPYKVDSKNYETCVNHLVLFTNLLQKSGCKYIIVPEQHKSGAYHFHGLVQGEMELVKARSPNTGRLLKDKQGRQIYNITNYKYGHTTATEVEKPAQTASYLAKYMTKDIEVPKGKKRYWASKGLSRPEVAYDNYSESDVDCIAAFASFRKDIEGKFGSIRIFEENP